MSNARSDRTDTACGARAAVDVALYTFLPMTIAPANGLFPMAAYGVETSQTLLISIVCALGASSCCYDGFGRRLGCRHDGTDIGPEEQAVKASMLKIVEAGGAEAVATVFRLIPMLILSLAIIYGIQASGMFTAIQIFLFITSIWSR